MLKHASRIGSPLMCRFWGLLIYYTCCSHLFGSPLGFLHEDSCASSQTHLQKLIEHHNGIVACELFFSWILIQMTLIISDSSSLWVLSCRMLMLASNVIFWKKILCVYSGVRVPLKLGRSQRSETSLIRWTMTSLAPTNICMECLRIWNINI